MIRELKRRIGEYQEYHDFTEEEIWAFRNSSWQIIPVNFQKRRAFASMIILLSAVNEGIGASFVGAFEDDKVTKILGLPVHVKPIGIIALGYPAEKPERFERIELNSLIHYEKYDRTKQLVS